VEKTRVDKSQVRLAECEVGDETGSVSLRARDDQINLLQEISNRKGAVVLRNCSLELYQGKFIRLAVSKWGKISSFPDGISSTPTPPSKMSDDVHLSIVDLNEVAGDEWYGPSANAPAGAGHAQGDAASSNHHSKDKNPRNQQSHEHHRGSGRGGYNDKRSQRYGNNYTPNPNVMHMNPTMVPAGMSTFSQPMYPSASMQPYGFAGHGHAQMQNTHPHQQQQQQQQQQHDQHKQQQDYLLFQQYTIQMQMQMDVMRLYQQQNQDLSGRHMFGQSAQGLPHDHSAHQESHASTAEPSPADFSMISVVSDSPMTAATTSAAGSQLSPDDRARNVAMSPPFTTGNDAWSIRQEAESPMMNPHAPVFTSSAYIPNMPSKFF